MVQAALEVGKHFKLIDGFSHSLPQRDAALLFLWSETRLQTWFHRGVRMHLPCRRRCGCHRCWQSAAGPGPCQHPCPALGAGSPPGPPKAMSEPRRGPGALPMPAGRCSAVRGGAGARASKEPSGARRGGQSQRRATGRGAPPATFKAL